ncbi:MAG: sugar phosphate nucleotidyltransferase [Planctomycetota bacterium]|jgi:dTDP-glucose pyrophosphorylase
MSHKKLIGVILAAGKGTRMLPFSTRYPKPLLPICNKPLIYYQIESMLKLGIKDIIIVISHLGFEIAKTIGDGNSLGARIKYVEQQQTLGIAHAVGQLEPHISSDFLLFLGDIFFVSSDLSQILKPFKESNVAAVLAVKEESNPEEIMKNFSVILDENGLVKRVIEKPRFIHNNLKGCGLYLFKEVIFDAIRRTPKTALRDEYEITETIQIMIEDGLPIKVAPIIENDINLTTPLDLLNCNKELIRLLGVENVVGENTQINEEAKIIGSVIGDNVIIRNPITIENSVIFSNSVVDTDTDLNYAIFSPDGIIDCRRFFA